MANYDQLEKTIQTVISKPIISSNISPIFCTATGVALSLVIQTQRGTSEIARNIKQIIIYKLKTMILTI